MLYKTVLDRKRIKRELASNHPDRRTATEKKERERERERKKGRERKRERERK